MTRLWEYSVENDEDVLILEHDSVMTGRLPWSLRFNYCMTLGRPSYGKFKTPMTLGTGPLTQKTYFKGAHAYVVSPKGASELLKKIPTHAEPADVYLNLNNFPWLEEYYPWIFEVKDSFSTIQKEAGCKAKHRSGIEVIDA
jgi:GR25 family glycosyltransferase involved in LPS biosynthesis